MDMPDDKYANYSYQAQHNLKAFATCAKLHGLSNDEIGSTWHELSLLISADNQSPLYQFDRAKIASEVLKNASKPGEISQGQHPTCNMTTVEKLLYWKEPSKVAQVINEVVSKGNYTFTDSDAKRHSIKLPDSAFFADTQETGSLDPDGKRNMASQIFQVMAINMATQRRTPPLIYEQEITTEGIENRLRNPDGTFLKKSNGDLENNLHIDMSEIGAVLKELSGKSGQILIHGRYDSPDILKFNSENDFNGTSFLTTIL
jgi:hypothetical protein